MIIGLLCERRPLPEKRHFCQKTSVIEIFAVCELR